MITCNTLSDGDLADHPSEARQRDIRASLNKIWEEVLGISTVPADRTFFDLGGSSISALQILSRVYESLGVSLPIALLFDANESTLENVAQYVELLLWALEASGPQLADETLELRLE